MFFFLFTSWLTFDFHSDLCVTSSDCAAGSRQQATKSDKRWRKIFPLRIRRLWKALHHCPPSQGSLRKLINFSTNKLFSLLDVLILKGCILAACCGKMHVSVSRFVLKSFVSTSCRYTSARTLAINLTSANIGAVERSLRQVAD